MPFLAYIDPGSGSMLLQVILAGILAVPFFFRRTIGDAWHKIRGDDDSSKQTTVPEETDSQH